VAGTPILKRTGVNGEGWLRRMSVNGVGWLFGIAEKEELDGKEIEDADDEDEGEVVVESPSRKHLVRSGMVSTSITLTT